MDRIEELKDTEALAIMLAQTITALSACRKELKEAREELDTQESLEKFAKSLGLIMRNKKMEEELSALREKVEGLEAELKASRDKTTMEAIKLSLSGCKSIS